MSVKFAGASWLKRATLFATGDNTTIMAWAYPTALPGTGAYSNVAVTHDAAAGQGYGIDLHNVGGTTHWSVGTQGTDFDGTSSVSVNVWKHVAAIRNGNTKTLYLDGTQESTGSDTGTNQPDLFVGDSAGLDDGDEWIGRIAAVKVWRVVLTQAEINAERFFAFPVARPKDVVAWFPMRLHPTGRYDASNYRRDLTATGTLTTESDPPGIVWTPPRRKVVSVKKTAASTGGPTTLPALGLAPTPKVGALGWLS